MWKHDILTDLSRLAPKLREGSKVKADTEYCINILMQESQSIYAGDITGYLENTLQKRKDIAIENTRPPYEYVLVMYRNNGRKRACLIKKTDSSLVCYSFQNEENAWHPCQILCKFDMETGLGEYINNIDPSLYQEQAAIESFKIDAAASMWCAMMVFQLLNCKNISLKSEDPPEKLNRSRIKKGKYPLFRYHVLMLDLDKGRKLSGKSANRSLGLMPVNLCRGHFKEYTAERPLFGKVTGRFWWEPFARGKPERGIVMKDYAIKEKSEQR